MADAANGWISRRDLRAGARKRLFCLPHAGSGSAASYRWKRALAPGIDVCPVLLPGREVRLAEAPMRDASALLDGLMQAVEETHCLDRPFAIFGHSMGALLAFEWACRLQAAGLPPPACLFVSGRDAAHLPAGHRGLHTLDDGALVAELRRRYGAMQQDLLDDPELREIFLPILRADLEVVETYRPTEARLACPVAVFAGRDDPSVTSAGLAAWGDLTQAGCTVTRFEGDHFYLHGAGLQALLAAIVEHLR